MRANLDLIDQSGSNTHTFGRRSRAAAEGDEEMYAEEETDDLVREASKATFEQQKYSQNDMIDP